MNLCYCSRELLPFCQLLCKAVLTIYDDSFVLETAIKGVLALMCNMLQETNVDTEAAFPLHLQCGLDPAEHLSTCLLVKHVNSPIGHLYTWFFGALYE